LTNLGTYYRFRVRVINVETAAIQEQYSYNMENDAQVAFLLSGNQGSAPPVAGTTAPSAPAPNASAGTAAQAAPSITGTIVPGSSLAEKLTWVQRSADSHNTYIIEVNADENIAPHVFEFRGGINITVVLRGVGANRTVRLRSNGTMFTIRSQATFILYNNITLMGHSQNTGPMVRVEQGIFKMNNGSAITGNTSTSREGGGVYVVGNGSTFEMAGGTISGNTADQGGGVYTNFGTFTMSGGTISGNTASRGGGIYTWYGTFTIRDGTITGNIARESGGGVWLGNGSTPFTKNGGTITGYSSDQANGNTVKDTDGYILGRKGHAVYVNENLRKETTAGPGASLTIGGTRGTTGAWDN
jgi:hypothetical protein